MFFNLKKSIKPLVAISFLIFAASASAQRVPAGGGWTYDPAIDGMKDLRALKPIEGCNVAGGLTSVTSTDEPGTSTQFWCGTPPFCLTDAALAGAEQCTILPYSRREPRYDPNGTPGVNSVRDPYDLVCTNTGLPPIAGRCPMPPTVSATLNGQQNLTAQVGTAVTLSVSSPNATQLRKACSGSNFGFTPFVEDNLDSIAGGTGSVGPGTLVNTGVTNCTITATNVRGSMTTTVSANATPVAQLPTISASFNPTRPTAGGSVQLVTSTTNATSVVWSCSGRWTNRNTGRNAGTVTTNHTASGSAGTANCSFTATGAGGTATATASWTSVTGGGSGTGNTGGGDTTVQNGCAAQNILKRASPDYSWGGNAYCTFSFPKLAEGQSAAGSAKFSVPVLECPRMGARMVAQCTNGKLAPVGYQACVCGDKNL